MADYNHLDINMQNLLFVVGDVLWLIPQENDRAKLA